MTRHERRATGILASLLLLFLLPGCTATTDTAPATRAATSDAAETGRMDWWREARFGLFIHWGLYAIPAGEWQGGTDHGEWIRETAHIPVGEYEQFQSRWNPVKFDADLWVRTAKQAGMKYIVITSKHHDGFCLFDSAQTTWDVMGTPWQRDAMKELAEACRRHGLKICWYHSIMDWHHPDYLPRRGWEEAARPVDGADFDRYRKYLASEVTELLTKYGPIGVMWFDGEWESTWNHAHGQELYDLCRRLQPDVIVNNRVDVGRAGMQGMTKGAQYAGDFGTPEQEIPATGLPGVDWETCMTMNDHWGYNAHDVNWKSGAELIRKLVDIASKGGNFLLNVGPRADGTFPEASVERLQEIGRWMAVNGDAIHGTTASPFDQLPFGRATVKVEPAGGGRERVRLFLHLFDWPKDSRLHLSGLGNEPRHAALLAVPGLDLAFRREEGDLVIDLPGAMPDPVCTVVALELDERPIVYAPPRIHADATQFVHRLTVTLAAGSPALETRFTLDGSEPTLASPKYTAPFEFKATTLLHARSFHGEKAVGPVVSQQFTRVAPALASAQRGAQPGLLRELVHGTFDRLPDLATTTFEVHDTAPAVSLPDGPAQERIVLRFTGLLDVPADELYRFALTSDDGARLWIDGQLVVDNDGLHGSNTVEGTAPLAKGPHAVTVGWFNQTGGADLRLEWAQLGEPLSEIPVAAWSR